MHLSPAEQGQLAACFALLAQDLNERDIRARLGEQLLRLFQAQHFASYVWDEAAQRWIAVPGLADFLFHRARRRPRLRAAFSGMLRETIDPSSIFSPRGLLKALTA